jgi:hypothetical protein
MEEGVDLKPFAIESSLARTVFSRKAGPKGFLFPQNRAFLFRAQHASIIVFLSSSFAFSSVLLP